MLNDMKAEIERHSVCDTQWACSGIMLLFFMITNGLWLLEKYTILFSNTLSIIFPLMLSLFLFMLWSNVVIGQILPKQKGYFRRD